MNSNDFFNPNWENLNLADFKLSFGDIVSIKRDYQIIKGIVLDFSEDEGGKWYGICFLENDKLFGSKIPHGFSNKFIDLLELIYLNETVISNLQHDGNFKIDLKKIGIGSKSVTENINFYIQQYNLGINQRIKTKTSWLTKVFSLSSPRKCYFDIKEILA